MNTSTDCMTPEKAEYAARCFVNGMRLHGKSGKMEPDAGSFSARLTTHPWVREAIMEGWGRELRSHLVLTIKRRIMRGESYTNVDDLMPPREWVSYAKQQAALYAAAKKWRDENIREGGLAAVMLNKIKRQAGL